MNHHCLPASCHRTALAAAVSSMCLLPALGSQAAEPGPIGGEFQVNTLTANNQTNPAIAVDADGDFVVAWQSLVAGNYDIRAQRYNAAGVAQGAEMVISAVSGNQARPAVAMDADGDFVIAWDSFFTGDNEIRAQRFNAAGNPQGGEIAVNTLTMGQQLNPTVAIDADGDFVIAWESDAGSGYDIRARRYNAAGVTQGGEFNVASLASREFNPSVALDADGDFVIAFDRAYTGTYEIRARRYNAAGVVQGGEFGVNSFITSDPGNPSVALDVDGDFVIAWQSNSDNEEIRAQRYDAAGIAQGGQIAVNTVTANAQQKPTVALDADGDFVIAWESSISGIKEIRAQRYNAGVAQGGEIVINTISDDTQRHASVALDADGDFVVAWQSYIVGSYDIRAQRYQGSNPVDVDLYQTDSADPAPVGSPLTYTLSVGNLQTPPTPTGFAVIDNAIGATGLRVIDTLPAGSTAVTATGTNWTCTFSTGKVTCDHALPLKASEVASPITVTLTPPNSPGAVLSNFVRVSASQFDDNLLNNRAVERTRLVCAESVIQLSASDYTVAENIASATITATRSGGACGVATVQFDTTGSSAMPGLDFTDVTGTLTWPDGELGNKTFTVPILNDGLDEINERVLINLSNVQGARFGAGNAARLTITDDDATPRVNFKTAAQTVPETPNLITVTARLGGLSGRNVTIPLTFTGTAGNGTDYFPTITSITIPAGQLEATADIEIAGDSTDEPDETVVIGMGTVSGATVGSINTHTITIVDDDVAATPTVSFNVATASANEATANTVLLQLSAASTQTVTVPYTRGGVATFPADYSVSLPSPITFNPGQVEKTIVITPVDDAVDEPNENLVLTLGTPTNATLGAGVSHRRTIVDNDP